MPLTQAERDRMIEQYATGPQRLRAAVEAVPEEARKWRPAEGEFSVHEIVVHCADAETNDAGRIRYIVASKDAQIVGYDESEWAVETDYHAHPLEAALATVEAVHANTVPLLKRLPDSAWDRAATHTESGRCTGADWLRICSEHLEEHVSQIAGVLDAWKAARETEA